MRSSHISPSRSRVRILVGLVLLGVAMVTLPLGVRGWQWIALELRVREVARLHDYPNPLSYPTLLGFAPIYRHSQGGYGLFDIGSVRFAIEDYRFVGGGGMIVLVKGTGIGLRKLSVGGSSPLRFDYSFERDTGTGRLWFEREVREPTPFHTLEFEVKGGVLEFRDHSLEIQGVRKVILLTRDGRIRRVREVNP